MIGFGVFQITDSVQCEKCVQDALQIGYRLIDTAASYQNEHAVGKAICGSGIPREEIFVTSKLWIQDAGYEKTLMAFERALSRLGLDYLDLYLIHQPYGDVHGSWRAMEELYSQGVIRAIGVSNFRPDRLMDLMVHGNVKPAVNQLEVNPFYQQDYAYEFAKAENFTLQGWAPFAEGKLQIFENGHLKSIAKKSNKTVAQLILRWLIQRGIPTIPKSVHKQRMAENIDVFDFEISKEDMDSIRVLDTNESAFFDHRDPAVVKWMSERRINT